MKAALIVLSVALCINLDAQTRRIGHRSHGGSIYTKGDHNDGNYGNPGDEQKSVPRHHGVRPYKVKVHLESGRDTMVFPWDSLARPYYLDTIQQMGFLMPVEIENISELGRICSKTILP